MFLQYRGDRPDLDKCDEFFTKLRDEDVLEIKVGDFIKKSLKVHRAIGKKYDFKSRCQIPLFPFFLLSSSPLTFSDEIQNTPNCAH